MAADYIPCQGDIVWLDFDPSSGREIQKRRPALVVSSFDFNRSTFFAVVCPITSTLRDRPTRVTLPHFVSIEGQILVSQMKSLDFRLRKMSYIERLPESTLAHVLQLVRYVFDG